MIQVRLVGGTQRHGVAALDRDHSELPASLVLNHERFIRHGKTDVYVFHEQVPR